MPHWFSENRGGHKMFRNVNEHKLSCSVPPALNYRERKATAAKKDIINNKTDFCTFSASHNTDHRWVCPILKPGGPVYTSAYVCKTLARYAYMS